MCALVCTFYFVGSSACVPVHCGCATMCVCVIRSLRDVAALPHHPYAFIDRGNVASQRTFFKLGFRAAPTGAHFLVRFMCMLCCTFACDPLCLPWAQCVMNASRMPGEGRGGGGGIGRACWQAIPHLALRLVVSCVELAKWTRACT